MRFELKLSILQLILLIELSRLTLGRNRKLGNSTRLPLQWAIGNTGRGGSLIKRGDYVSVHSSLVSYSVPFLTDRGRHSPSFMLKGTVNGS
jgi:hypothetical protein